MSRKHKLFFVHGMGTHDDKWHEDGLKALKNGAEQFSAMRALDFDETFEAIPIVYDNIFETWRERFGQDFEAFKGGLLEDLAPEELPDEVEKVGEILGVGSDSPVYTHALDVVLYRFSNTIRASVDVKVCRQILDGIDGDDYRSWSVIGYSLGSSVAHNALNALYGTKNLTDENGETIRPLKPVQTRPRAIAMVANVSRVLQRSEEKVWKTDVKPGSPYDKCICGSYLNVRHRFDPFCIPKPFDPDHSWLNPVVFNSPAYQHIRPTNLHFKVNELGKVHSFSHYMAAPRVHVPLFREILGRDIILDFEFEQARAAFENRAPSKSLDGLRNKLEQVGDLVSDGDLSDFIKILLELYK